MFTLATHGVVVLGKHICPVIIVYTCSIDWFQDYFYVTFLLNDYRLLTKVIKNNMQSIMN